jgi:hypothetical protein
VSRPFWAVHLDARRATAGALAGLAGGAAFAAVMRADQTLSGQPLDDFLLLSGIGPYSERWRLKGALLHALNSAVLGKVYAAVEPVLRGPGWARGLTFALAENTILWPLLLLVDRYHPAVRAGTLPRYNRPWPFLAENLRHAAYGLTLGYVFPRILARSAPHSD